MGSLVSRPLKYQNPLPLPPAPRVWQAQSPSSAGIPARPGLPSSVWASQAGAGLAVPNCWS